MSQALSDFHTKVEEFKRLYVNAETGIVKVDITSETPPKISVWVDNWDALQKVPDSNIYEGIAITWGIHIPDDVVFMGGGMLVTDEPGPPLVRNHADTCTCVNCAEANKFIARAAELAKAEKWGRAKHALLKGIAQLEKYRPLNQDMAKAYRDMTDYVALMRARNKAHRRQLDIEAIGWYEKAIKVWEGLNDLQNLRGNLTNLGSFYYCIEDYETALERELRGLAIEKMKGNKLNDESVAPFNHVAGCYLKLGRLDEAEATIRDGFAHIGDDTPNSGYLWNTLAEITKARAATYRKRAEELIPPDSCSIG